jgi:hypothetical protein
MGPAMAAEARQKHAPEQAETRPSTAGAIADRPTGGPDVGTLLYLQRTAGNAAVASLMERRRPPPSVQRCAGGACDCSPEERQEHEETATPLTVQRGWLDVLEGAATSVLPDSVKSLITGSSGEAKATAGQVHEKGTAVSDQAHSQGTAVLDQSKGDAQAAASSSEGQMRSHSEQAQSLSSATVKTGTVDADRGQAAVGNLGSMGSFAEAMVNPVGPMVALPQFEEAVRHVGSVLAAIPGGAAGLAGDLELAVTEGLKGGQGGGWNCDEAQIMAIAGGVETAVTSSAVKAGKKVMGEDRYEALAGWANARVADLKRVAATIRAKFEAAKQWLQDFWTKNVAPLIKQLQGVMEELGKLKDQLVTYVGEQFEKVKKLAASTWAAIRSNVIEPVVAFAHAAKDKVTRLVAGARAAIGSWWDKLPKVAQNAIIGSGEAIAAPFALALAGAQKGEQLLASLAEALAAQIKLLSDRVLQALASQYQTVRKIAVEAIDRFKKAWTVIKQKASQYLSAAYAKVDGATGGRITKLMAAVAGMKRKISGEACSVLGEVSGPCIEQFVPNPGKGEEADVTLASSADVTVPVYDVPVKIGRGASIKLSRKERKYTATESGDGLIAISLAEKGGGPGSVSVDASALGMGGSWKNLTGNETAPAAAPAAGGSSAGPEAKGGPEAEAEAGYKASIDMAYLFDASAGKDTTCDGLGGLTAFLGAQGLSGVLPPPFGMIAGQAVTSSYAENLTSCIVTLLEYGKASVNLKQEGVGGLEAAIKGQAGVALEHTKDEKEGWIDTATLSESVGASIAAKLATGGPMPLSLGGEAGVTATLFAKMKYAESTEKITALGAGGKLALSLDLDPVKVQAIFPTSVAGQIVQTITPYVNVGAKGSLEVEASYEVQDVQNLILALDTYFNETPASAVNTDGLFKIVNDYLASAQIKEELKVKLNTERSIAKGAVAAEGTEIGGSMSVELTEHHSKTIYAYPEEPSE